MGLSVEFLESGGSILPDKPAVTNHKVLTSLLLGVTALFLILVYLAATDVRGSDQYWYMADVETLLQGDPPLTNNLFPTQVLAPGPQQRPFFIHHILNLYLVLPAAWLAGPFGGWILTNVFATLITAALIALLTVRFASAELAVWAYSVYLLLPLTLWLTAQPLAEATIAPFVALGMLAYERAGTKRRYWIVLAAALVGAYFCRSTYIVLLFLLPGAYLWQNRPVGKNTILQAAALLAAAVVAVAGQHFLFPESLPISWSGLLNNAIPGVTGNMYNYFCLTPIPVQWEYLGWKFASHLAHHFFPPLVSEQIFYAPFNLLAILALLLFGMRKSESERRISQGLAVLLLLHFATIVLVQNQFRYLLVTLPPLLAAGAITGSRISRLSSKSIRLRLLLGTIVLLVIADLLPVWRLHRQGIAERNLRAILVPMFDKTIPPAEPVLVEVHSGTYQLVGYVLRPRDVVFVQTGYSREQCHELRARSGARWFIGKRNSPLLGHLAITGPPVIPELPAPYDQYAVFRL